MNPNARARRIAFPNFRWFLAVQPVRLAGNIRPMEDTKFDNNAQFCTNVNKKSLCQVTTLYSQ